MPTLPRLLQRAIDRTRRRVLAHRRLLAFLLTTAAVAAGLHAVAPPGPHTVAVTVAAADLPAGEPLGADDVTTVRLLPGAVPDGVVASPVGSVLAAPLRRGEPVTDARLVGPDLTNGRRGLVAVPVRLPDPAMAGLLEPGHRIDLFAVDPSGAAASDGGGAERVAPGVLVLAVPEEEAETAVTTGLGGRLVIVGVAEHAVTRVTAASVRSFLTYAFAS